MFLLPFKRNTKCAAGRFAGHANRGFSLIELLTVVAIMSVVMGLSAQAIMGSFRSSGITSAGNQIVDMVAVARQIATSKNVLTAVVFAPEIQDVKGRALRMMEYGPDRSWREIGGWTVLPESAYATNFSAQASPAAAAMPQMTFRGKTFAPDNALIFYPDGRLHQATTPKVKVRVVGSQDAGAANSAANYYDIVLNRDNSAYQVFRP